MSDSPASRKSISPDWLVRGILTKLGDTFDKLTGRGWKPSSSLATSELIEKLKALLDSEAEISADGRGTFVPHNIKLKMQWDKFATDSENDLQKLENELLTAVVDHINDKRYFTHKPLSVEVRPDYFTSGVKLLVSFERFDDEDDEAEVNVLNTTLQPAPTEHPVEAATPFKFHYVEGDKPKTVEASLRPGQRLSVGRTKENDIFINDPSVSKLHASFALDDKGGLLVADTGSTNGTFIDGRRIAYGRAESVPGTGKVTFGTVEVSIECLPVPQPEPAAESQAAPTVAIGGFEFSSRPPTSEESADEPRDTAKQIDATFSGTEAITEK